MRRDVDSNLQGGRDSTCNLGHLGLVMSGLAKAFN